MVDKAVILANARTVMRELMSEPDALPLVSAAAAAGNFWVENYMRPIAPAGEPRDHGSEGLAQWRLGRLRELQRMPNWETIETQCRFFKLECKRDYPGLWAQLSNPGTRTIENLTANICDHYERPSAAGRVIDRRIGFAKQVYKLFDAQPAPSEAPKLPPALQPVSDKPSGLLGVLALLAAFLTGNGSPIGHMIGGSPVMWLAIAGILIFFIDTRKNAPTQPKESNMLPIVEIIGILEKVVPLLVKYGPALEELVKSVETGGDLATRVAAITAELDKLNKPAA